MIEFLVIVFKKFPEVLWEGNIQCEYNVGEVWIAMEVMATYM